MRPKWYDHLSPIAPCACPCSPSNAVSNRAAPHARTRILGDARRRVPFPLPASRPAFDDPLPAESIIWASNWLVRPPRAKSARRELAFDDLPSTASFATPVRVEIATSCVTSAALSPTPLLTDVPGPWRSPRRAPNLDTLSTTTFAPASSTTAFPASTPTRSAPSRATAFPPSITPRCIASRRACTSIAFLAAISAASASAFVTAWLPVQIHIPDRVVVGVEVAVQARRVVDLAEVAVLGQEAAEDRVVVPGLGVIQPRLGVPDVSCEAEAVS